MATSQIAWYKHAGGPWCFQNCKIQKAAALPDFDICKVQKEARPLRFWQNAKNIVFCFKRHKGVNEGVLDFDRTPRARACPFTTHQKAHRDLVGLLYFRNCKVQTAAPLPQLGFCDRPTVARGRTFAYMRRIPKGLGSFSGGCARHVCWCGVLRLPNGVGERKTSHKSRRVAFRVAGRL